jgi:glutathione peroxidase
MTGSIYESEVETLDGKRKDLSEYRGKVMLIVNTASQCGLTPQYAGLERLYQQLRERGVEILGFPCNQFGKQEPGTSEQIGAFCEKNYGVTFPMYKKVDVNGPSAHPLFVRLKTQATGMFGSRSIKWNFTKFLVDKNGEVIKRFSPTTPPASIKHEIEALLK